MDGEDPDDKPLFLSFQENGYPVGTNMTVISISINVFVIVIMNQEGERRSRLAELVCSGEKREI